MTRKNYIHKFDRIVINNRWRLPLHSRSSEWVYIGIWTRYFSPTEYEYVISLFGIDI